MPTYNSPGVYIVEKDFSEFPPSVNSSIAGIVGFASRGRPNKAKLITSTTQLLEEFGRPDRVLGGQGVLAALEILNKTSSLYFVRAINTSGIDASAQVPYGVCPAVAVSGDAVAGPGGGAGWRGQQYGKFLFKISNDASSDVTPTQGRSADHAAYYELPVDKWTDSTPAVGTRQAGAQSIVKAISAKQTSDFPFTFVSSTSGSGPIGWFVGTYAGSGASLEVSAASGSTNTATAYAHCRVLTQVSATTGEVSGSAELTGSNSHVTGYGGTDSGGGPGGTYFVQSMWAGKGYNYSAITVGNNTNYYGLQVKVNSKIGKDWTFQVFNDGGFEESYTMDFVKDSQFPEQVLNVGTTDATSNFIKASFYNGLGPQVPKTNAESWTAPTSFQTLFALTDNLVVTNSNTAVGVRAHGVVSDSIRFAKFIDGTSSLYGGTNGDLADNSGSFNDTIRSAFIGSQASKTGIYALDDESLNISMACIPGISDQILQNTLVSIAETSQNFMALVSPPKGLTSAQDAINWTNGVFTGRTAALNSSYAAVYWPWVKIFDVFSAADTWVDPAAFAIGAMCETDRIANTWSAPAGLVRGRLTRPFDVEVSLNQGDRDALYGAGECVNPIVKFAGDGIVIWGQKTTQRASTALDRVNIRRMMIIIRKILLASTRPLVFEPNDPITWSRVVNIVQPLLNNIKNGRGITEFRVVCDETTNTPLRVDRNEMWCRILIKPTKTAEVFVIELNLTNQSADIGTT